jgi:hypothetical protein
MLGFTPGLAQGADSLLFSPSSLIWRKGENQLPKVVQGVKFQNGIEVIKMSAHHAA